MEGKLIKLGLSEGYRLDDLNGNYIASTLNGKNKLSLKNCEAIENGYDLDELAKIYSGKEIFEDGYDGLINPHTKMFIEVAYIKGFQKALEILADKKYTETELYHAFLINSAGNNTTLRNFFEQTVLPMFKDNAWNVEICCYIGNGDKESDSFKDPIVTNTGIPKLDANGCLILRRI